MYADMYADMRTFEVIMPCMLTWDKRNLDLSGEAARGVVGDLASYKITRNPDL